MFSDDIDHLYAAMLGERSWAAFLQHLTRDIPAGKATMQMYDHLHRDNSFVAQQTGFDSAALEAYKSHYVTQNLLQQAMAAKPGGVGIPDDALVPGSARRRNSFFNEWLMPNEVRASAGIKISTSGQRVSSLVLLSGHADDDGRTHMARKLTTLGPHLQRARAFYKQFSPGTQMDLLSQSVPEVFGAGVMLIRSDGHIAFMNSAVAGLLEGQTTPLVFNNSRLHVRPGELADRISLMTRTDYAGPRSVDFYLPHLKVSLRRPEQDNMHMLFYGASLIIMLSGLTATPLTFERRLIAQTYRLTPAEMRAIDGLVGGKNAADIATEAGLSRETIRAQIRSLYAKTGAHSQADIIRLVRPR